MVLIVIFTLKKTDFLPSSQVALDKARSSSGFVVTKGEWTVNSCLGVSVATHQLQMEQPENLEIDIPINFCIPFSLKQLFQVVQQRFTGTLSLLLWNSYFHYEDCTELVETLANSR